MKKLVIIDNFDIENRKFKDRFDNLLRPIQNSVKWEYIHYSKLSDPLIFNSVFKVDGILLTGSYNMLSVSETLDKYKKEIKIIQDFTKPLLGICFGLQLIAASYGFKIKLMDNPDYNIEEEKLFLLRIDPEFNMYASDAIYVYETHHEEIEFTPEFENEFRIYASTDACKIQAVKHHYREIYGVQFHPENPTDLRVLENGKELIKNFVEKL